KAIPHFIVIDDDPFNNAFCEMLLTSKAVSSYVTVQTFTAPEEGLKHIQNNYIKTPGQRTVLFLDIIMPTMSAWDFLKQFENLDPAITECFKIYILSSSIDPRDKKRALEHKYVEDYIVKPLTIEMVNTIIEQVY
ncbi:MAG: response regulator, partial [Parafilimonas sp.]